MSYEIIRPASHEGWLQARKEGIGSSEVATILGANPYESVYRLWRRKKGMDAEKAETFAMKAGHYLEDAVSRFYADETGRQIIKRSAGDWLAVDRDRPYLRVSPDRTYWIDGAPKNRKNKGIVECKTTQMKVDADDVPMYWFCQLQYQLGVMGLKEGSLAWLTAGREFGYKDFAFDADFYGWMTDQIETFWNTYIEGDEEPEPVCAEDVMTKWPRSREKKVVEAGEALKPYMEELQSVKRYLAELDTRKKQLEDALKVVMEDAEELTYREDTGAVKVVATWRTGKNVRKFDEKTFAKDKPEEYAAYTKEAAGVRRFVFKGM